MGSFGKNAFQSPLLPAFNFFARAGFQRTFNRHLTGALTKAKSTGSPIFCNRIINVKQMQDGIGQYG
jgi:hypothetical protein